MAGEFHDAARASGWTIADGAVRGPHGTEAWLDGGGDGRPDHEHLCFGGESGGHRFTFAVSFADPHRRSDIAKYRRSDIAKRALHGPDAVAAGAVVPWLDRMRELAGVWVRADAGPWWPLGGGTGSDRVARPSGQVQERVTAWLETLVRDPAAEAVGRGERTLEILRGAGWRPAVSRTGKAKPGFRCLAAATSRGPGGAKHRVEYVLMGDARLPEALLWRYELPAVGGKPVEKATLLVDVTGAMDPDVPLTVGGDRLATVLGVLTREAPAMETGGSLRARLALLTVAAALRVHWNFSAYRAGFREELGSGFSTREAPPLDEAAAAVRAAPNNGARWLAFGLAAVEGDLRHFAVGAFAKAAELDTGNAVPLLWHGWLLRALDRDLALAQLDRAAAAGDMVGLARELQGDILRLHGDRDAALAAYARATEEDPGHADGWLSHGLHLAKYGRAAEAVRVLTEAAARHPDSRVAYYLGYARLLSGDRDGALDALEDAVRRDPGLASTIVEDADLAPLRGQPRFDALPAFAAAEEAALHRRTRDAVRPTGAAPALPRNRANDLDAVMNVRDIFRRRVDGHRRIHPWGVTHPDTRWFLESVGLPREAGTFRLDRYFDGIGGSALREYHPDDPHGRLYGADRVPAGLAGLFVLGELDGGAEAALDGRTGEVYRVAEDFSVSWLATDLEAFLLPRCLPDDAWIWRLTTDTVGLLDGPDVARIGAGKLALVVEGLDGSGHERLHAFLRERGELLHCLRVTANLAAGLDLTGIDLATCCPKLAELRLRSGTVNESVFHHPALTKLVLRESEYKGTIRDLDLDAGSRLSELSLDDCLVHADTLRAGPGSPLRWFRAAIDEDYGFVFPNRLEFDNCPDLSHIDIDFDAGTWELVLRGSLPRLREVSQDARPYGSFTSTVVAATPADKKAYQSMIRKGSRHAR
ncbi:tetratricopeptide repeat protein [Micromonospora sp. NPDC049559]|uniref:tetratricopeptide repeat protein n=1 Tax=Micromonospora sp. NPDC049559 TaxID=3155923 RepID=UPI00344AE6CF